MKQMNISFATEPIKPSYSANYSLGKAAFARAAKAAASSSGKFETTSAPKPAAEPAAAPAPSKTPWREPSQEMEFHLPDEDRVLCEVLTINPCHCGSLPRLRKSSQHTNLWQMFYRVECRSCEYTTPWLPSSAEAIQHWRVTQVLSKP